MKRENTQLVLLLVSSWLFYAFCQSDFLLPSICFLIVLSHAFMYRRRPARELSEQFPWLAAAVSSLVVGWLWKNVILDASVPREYMTLPFFASLQSGSVIMALIVWLRISYAHRAFTLKLLFWVTVAFSADVSSGPLVIILFLLFCAVNVWFIFITHSASVFREKSSTIVSKVLPAFFILTAVGFSFLFMTMINKGDKLASYLINEYFICADSGFALRQDPYLRIGGRGPGRGNISPVLEIDRREGPTLYLQTQVFEEYADGIWRAQRNEPRFPLPTKTETDKGATAMSMYRSLEDIIPAPKNVVAVREGKETFRGDENGNIYAHKIKNARRLFFLRDDQDRIKAVEEEDVGRLTVVPDELDGSLKEHLSGIVGVEHNNRKVAQLIENYFKENYRYSTEVHFPLGNKAVLALLEERDAAYCTHFASAMALLLRARGIPARLVSGFLAQEVSHFGGDKFLVRLRDAHAWVEVALPVDSSPDKLRRWVRFDPTPASPDSAIGIKGGIFGKVIDWLWRILLTIRLEMQYLDWIKLLKFISATTIIIILLRNMRKIPSGLRNLREILFSQERIPEHSKDEASLVLYQRYESLMKRFFGTYRRDEETDREFIDRLETDADIPERVSVKIHSFTACYHAVRFGSQKDSMLNDSFEGLETEIRELK